VICSQYRIGVQLPGLCTPQWRSSFQNGRQVNKANSDDSMETSQGSGRMIRAKKTRRSRSFERRVEESDQESLKFKMVLRFGKEKGISSMNPVKLTTIWRNQIGDIHMAKVLRDGNLLIVCRNEEQRERAGRMKEIGPFNVINTSRVERENKWSKGVIWGVPVNQT